MPNTNNSLIIPQYEDFCYMLHDRIHTRIVRYDILKNEDFTLFINVLDRTELQIRDKETFIYAGIKKQRQLFEGYDKENRIMHVDEAWDYLDKQHLFTGETVETKGLFYEFQKEDYELTDINFSELKNYFDRELVENQIHEKVILEYHLRDFSKYLILSLPIIQFAEFEGVVHIVFKREYKDDLASKIHYLIKAFSDEYENLLMDWDTVGGNINEPSLLLEILERIMALEYYEEKNKNPILRELNYLEHYRNVYDYLTRQRALNDTVFLKMMEHHRKAAITAILLDSFAHNISAHSLTALNWWFSIRADILEYKLDIPNQKSPSEYLKSLGVPQFIIGDQKLSRELHPLFKFLLQKGAFWTGLIRDKGFGGKNSSLFSALWHDFINNPLYLGTIAYTEGILKINVNLTISQKVEDQINNKFCVRKQIQKHVSYDERANDLQGKEVLLNGRFATIDLKQFFDSNADNSQLSKQTDFVIKSSKYYHFKEFLTQAKVFFPGSIVGRHALFTMIENEIRNVKHHDQTTLQEMRKNGLTLNISIEESDLLGQTGNNALYFIGIWIGHAIKLDKDLVLKRLLKMEGDIITSDTHRPILGGTSQDKVCAALLLNNEFVKVQDTKSEIGQFYYPWVKIGCGDVITEETEVYDDVEISLRNYRDDEDTFNNWFANDYKPRFGYLKKYFHLWKGDDILTIDEDTNLILANPFRYRFVALKEVSRFKEVRKKDVIRIINQEVTTVENAYLTWLRQFIGKHYSINFKIDGNSIAQVIFDENGLEFLNKQKIDDELFDDVERLNLYDTYENLVVKLQHGGDRANPNINLKADDVCRYRSHGIFKQYYCDNTNFERVNNIKPEILAELIEVLATKVCIFDNRIAKRVSNVHKEFYDKTLSCSIYDEVQDISETAEKEWEKAQIEFPDKQSEQFQKAKLAWEDANRVWSVVKNNLEDYHFLVMHLSFIETLKGEKGEKLYDESELKQFIDNEILSNPNLRERAGKDFFLVVTSGRARSEWWRNIENNDTYNQFVTFREIEALIDAVELGMHLKDDFELKHRLVKVLFGS